MADFTLTECTRQNACYDCENERCCLAGKKKSDCPKYHCDNPNGIDDCDHCTFIDDFIMGARKSHGLVSDKEVSKMCHCVGYDKKKVYHRRGKAYFKPYRNYVYAGGSDIELWDRLVEIGVADKNKNINAGDKYIYYWLNKRGLDILSYLLNVYIYSESANGNEIDASEDVIEVLLEDEVYCGYECWLPSSAKDIAFRARLPRKLTIDTLHYLRDKCGYVKNDSYGDIDSDGFPHCTHGWSITKKWLDEHKERFEAARKRESDRIDLMLRGYGVNDNSS